MVRFGVAVSHYNRPAVLAATLKKIKQYSPPGIPIVVVDDGSRIAPKVPEGVTLIRHKTNQGIPATKNRCLAELMDTGVEHLFLFDDDTHPTAENWWLPYVSNVEPHLQYSWTRFARDGAAVPGMDEVLCDPGMNLVAYTHSMGCMLYVERKVVEGIGGMRWEFGRGYEEHLEWSERIHAAGFTLFTHQDVIGAELYAGDEHYSVSRSVAAPARAELVETNARLRESLRGSSDYVEYHPMRDVVLTSYFSGVFDDQRPASPRAANLKVLQPLMDSVGSGSLVVLHNCFDSLPCDNVRLDCPVSPYVYRWMAQYRWLRDHPEVDYGWLVDATDVRMLNDPFPWMQPGTLYVGWEPTVLGCDWIKRHCPARLEGWVSRHSENMLLNTGVVGGRRRELLGVCRDMVDVWASTDRADPLYEMVLFNYVVTRSDAELVTGPQVTTVFKSYCQSDKHSWWAHK